MNRAERKQYNYNLKHEIIDGEEYKQCSICKQWKPMTEEFFYIWNHSVDGYHAQCAECQRKAAVKRHAKNPEAHRKSTQNWYKKNAEHKKNYVAEWYQNNREYKQEYHAEYMKNNPDKQKQYSENHRDHDVSTAEYEAMLKVFNYQCAYCGMTAKEHKEKYKQKLHNDHVDNQGYNDLRNDVPACKSCNDKKNTKELEEWYNKDNINYTEERYNKIIWWITEGYEDYIEKKPPYRFSRSRVYNEDGTYFLIHELWTVNEKRNMIECIAIGERKKDLNIHIENLMKEYNNKGV